MAEMHSGIKSWKARASDTVCLNLQRPHLGKGRR